MLWHGFNHFEDDLPKTSRTHVFVLLKLWEREVPFVPLCRRAIKAEYLNQVQAYLSLALKAQSQCRNTLHTLGELKYPKETAFIRQQNVAVNQQVNNGTSDGTNDPRTRAGEIFQFDERTIGEQL